MTTLSLIAIIVAIALLIYLAYKGWSIIAIAPLLAIVAAIGCGQDLFTGVLGGTYFYKAGHYVGEWFAVFLFGAIFAKLMEEGGLAASIANKISDVLGADKAILAVILGCAVLTYGGLSVFVVAFVMYPFGAVLFRKAGIPKRLLPAALWMGIFSFTMVALPGTPQTQNIIPTRYFGTSTWSGVGIGLFATACYLAIALVWLGFRTKQAKKAGEGYGNHPEEGNLDIDASRLPGFGVSLIPLLLVILINIFGSNPFNWAFIPWKIESKWAVAMATALASVATIIIGHKNLIPQDTGVKNLVKIVNGSAGNAGHAIFNVASGYAFGCVVTSVVGFEVIAVALEKLSSGGNPLWSAVVTTNIMGGITGSASSGMTIALDKFGETWKNMALSSGVSLDALHRIVAVSAIGLDPVPHCGALVTMFGICKLTHKESYFDLVMLMLFKFLVPYLCVIWYLVTGIA